MLQHASYLHFLLWLRRILSPLYISTFCLSVHPFMDIGLLPTLGYFEFCYYKHRHTTFYVDIYLHFSWVYIQKLKLGSKVILWAVTGEANSITSPLCQESMRMLIFPGTFWHLVFDIFHSSESRWVWLTLRYWFAFFLMTYNVYHIFLCSWLFVYLRKRNVCSKP